MLDDEKATTAGGFLRRAVAFYRRHGITVERVMSDNGACYRSTIHAVACRTLGLPHLRTRPYRPRTNGKAERFIRTFLAGWAYGAIYATSTERTAALDGGLWTYNHRRPHGAPSHQPPIARLNELNNLAGSYSYASTSAASPREWLLPSWTGEAWRARRRRSFQVIPSRSSAGMPIATAVAISTAWRMMP